MIRLGDRVTMRKVKYNRKKIIKKFINEDEIKWRNGKNEMKQLYRNESCVVKSKRKEENKTRQDKIRKDKEE